jgi:hypothetical protein
VPAGLPPLGLEPKASSVPTAFDPVQRSANRLVRFRGGSGSIRLTVEVSGMCRGDALRAAAGEVARIFPASNDERYEEPRLTAR